MRHQERERESSTDGECHSRRLSYCGLFYDRVYSNKHGEHIKGFPNTNHAWCKLLKDRTDGRYDFTIDIHGHFLPHDNPAQREKERERERRGAIYGFPIVKGQWCNASLKRDVLRGFQTSVARGARENSRTGRNLRLPCEASPVVSNLFQGGNSRPPLALPQNEGQKTNIVHYIGIAADEPLRIKKHIDKPDKVLPLVQIGWDEALCGLEATYMDMLSPTYTDGQMRDGCWFCHNQGVAQLRRLRKLYPDLWAKLLRLDLDSPVTFHADGHTVHDFDRRFEAEDSGLIDSKRPFRWAMLDDDLQYNLFTD